MGNSNPVEALDPENKDCIASGSGSSELPLHDQTSETNRKSILMTGRLLLAEGILV